MGTLGKVLIVFNIIAGAAFISLATMSWGKRQAWTYAVLRYELIIAGLPVLEPANADKSDPEVVPFGFQYGDSPAVATVSSKTLDAIFLTAQGGKPLGGPAVSNQVDEVKRVRKAIDDALRELTDPEEKRAMLRGFLLNQARNFDDRANYNALTADAAKYDQAKAELDKLFDAALAPVTEAKGDDKHSLPLKRREIAHLLFHLSDTPEWQTRVWTVVGLEQYAKTIDLQVIELAAMTQRMILSIRADQARFEPAYQDIIQRCMFQQQELEKLQATLRDQKVIFEGLEVIRKDRAEEARLLEEDLKDISTNVKKDLAKQTESEKTLFQIHQDLKLALDTIIAMEAQLRKVELINTPSGK